jgi:hypothetical protein
MMFVIIQAYRFEVTELYVVLMWKRGQTSFMHFNLLDDN